MQKHLIILYVFIAANDNKVTLALNLEMATKES